jgi:PKD repeat protein
MTVLVPVGLGQQEGVPPMDLPEPSVDEPVGIGPYTPAKTYDMVTLTDKGMTIRVRADYPALDTAENATPNMTGAPYPVIFFGPGAGCNENSYGGLARDTVGWGFVFITIGFDWAVGDSGNVADFRDVVDHYLAANTSAGHKLYQMLDSEKYASGGHSHGARVAARSTPYIPEFKLYMGLSPSIMQSEVNVIADDFDIPMQLHTGTTDPVPGHNYMYNTIDTIKEKVTAIGAGHSGQFYWPSAISFMYYHLNQDARYEYWTYKAGIMKNVAEENITLKYDRQDGRFFPPVLTATSSKTEVVEDEELSLEVVLDGYYDPDFSDDQFHWDFHGDGDVDWNGSDPENLTMSYDHGPDFFPSIQYKLGDVEISDDAVSHKISVLNVAPVANVVASGTELDEDVRVDLNGSSSEDTPSDHAKLEYRFVFGDGAVREWDTDPTANHTYTKDKEFQLEMTVRDDDMMTDTVTLEMTVNNVAPTLEPFDDMVVAEDEVVRLAALANDTASDRDGLMYMWDLGDGNVTDWSGDDLIEHGYPMEGNYTVISHVKDDDGSQVSETFTITVRNMVPAVSILMPTDGWKFKEGEEVMLSGEAVDNGSDVAYLEYSWDRGDGTVSEWSDLPSDLYTYETSGTFMVVLRARDDDGAVGTAAINVTIENVVPTAEIDDKSVATDLDEDEAISLKALVEDTPADMADMNITWHVEALGLVVHGPNATFSFSDSGFYEIVLKAVDDDGAEATDSLKVTVSNVLPGIVDVGIMPAKVTVGDEVVFWANATDTPSDLDGLSFSWDMDDGTVHTNASGNHTYLKAGTYNVALTVTDDDPFSNAHRFFTIEVKEKEVPPPPPPPPNGNGDDGMSMMVLAGLGALVIGVVVLLAALLMMRRRGPSPVEKGAMPEEGGDQDQSEE